MTYPRDHSHWSRDSGADICLECLKPSQPYSATKKDPAQPNQMQLKVCAVLCLMQPEKPDICDTFNIINLRSEIIELIWGEIYSVHEIYKGSFVYAFRKAWLFYLSHAFLYMKHFLFFYFFL